ncbi:hypothetical protein OG864_00325 [Streptomyces sp. NBC_00124]|uniref:hypothetical protein n=1 Tax=Streptomyces sp. NBC_00124 TaxID=2975662 RepID=UPI00225901DA|nr:hypothetical protein [Streptomyces sp. NBC_00124]MCX5357233.1 hypothetical protein [Streptomyces sp. NBC_00124]
MIPASSSNRSRRLAATAGVLTVIGVVAGAVILVLGAGLPEVWWPHTGQAFTADARPAHPDSCASIVGPAKAYCARGATAAAGQQDAAAAALRLVPVGAGVAVLVVWRLRHAAAQRRR